MFDLPKIFRFTSELSPLPTIAAEGLTHIVLYVNPAFCKLVGKEKQEMVGRPFAEAIPDGDENGCIALLDRVYNTGQTESLPEHRQAHVTSSPVYWSYSVWAVLDLEDRIAGVMVHITDATETALFRQQVTSMNEKLLLSSVAQYDLREQAEELNSRLNAAIQETNHRVKNNLQVISTLAEIQIDGATTTVPVSALQRIVTHIRTIADLHDLLTQRGKSGNEEDTLDTAVSLGRLIPLLQAGIASRRIFYEIAVVPLSISKSSSLSLLISELVSNAYKHGAGDISITLTREEQKLHLTVSDTGQGFPSYFDPVTAAHTGLDIIRSLAEHSLRGTITFTNNPTGGARIIVVFPHQSRTS